MEDGDYLELDCGRCPACRSKRVRSWAIRAHCESQEHTRISGNHEVLNGCFVTLTYDPEHLPSDESLDVSHWQNFAKKLRRELGPFRYIHCGEYGAKGDRPHYHACIFGHDFHEDRIEWKRDSKSVVWLSETLNSLWGKGFTTLGPLNYATASYVAGYVMKKLKNDEFLTANAIYGSGSEPIQMKKPEYVTMSRRPGLGYSWFQKYWRDVYPADRIRIDGKEFTPPKYFDDLLAVTDPVTHFEVMEKRKLHLEKQGPTSDNALKARRGNFLARYAQKKPRM